jgi:hypothetical protein
MPCTVGRWWHRLAGWASGVALPYAATVKYPMPRGPIETEPDLSRADYATVRKLIEEIKRLYGSMAECLDDVQRRGDTWNAILLKERQIAAIVPAPDPVD